MLFGVLTGHARLLARSSKMLPALSAGQAAWHWQVQPGTLQSAWRDSLVPVVNEQKDEITAGHAPNR